SSTEHWLPCRGAVARDGGGRGGLLMEFAETAKVRELREKVWTFLDECVRPAEPRYWREFSAETIPHRISPVMDELKAEARKRGLWNLFMPDDRFGAGLSNAEYAP